MKKPLHYKNLAFPPAWRGPSLRWTGKLKSTVAIIALLFAFGSARAQLSGNYTIDSSAVTAGTNFQSFTDFADTLHFYGISAAVTVDVAMGSGPYDEQITFNEVLGADADNPITINGNGETIINANGAVITMDGADYFTFDNLVIDASGTGNGTRNFQFLNNADFNTVSNCELIVSAYDGTNNSTGYVVFSSDVSSNNSAGDHGFGNVFEGNEMWNGGNGSDIGPYSGVSDYRSGGASNSVFQNNDIRDVYYYFTYFYYSEGVDFMDNDLHHNREGSGCMIFFNQNGGQIDYTGNKIHDISSENQIQVMTFTYCSGTDVPSQISNNEFYNFQASYFNNSYIEYCDYLEVKNNHAHDFSADDFYSALWRFWNCNDLNVSFNEYSHFTSQWANGQIFSFDNCYTLYIEGNSVHDIDAGYMYGVFQMYYCDDVQMINNLFYNNGAANEHSQVFSIVETHNINFAHNTIVSDGMLQYCWALWLFDYWNGPPQNVNCHNNIVYLNVQSSGAYIEPIYIWQYADRISWANNVWYDISTSTNKYYYANNTGYPSFELWAEAVGDLTSVTLNPQFVSTSNLTPQNPAISNIGTPGLATLDYNGTTRTACGPDPGAFEFLVDHSASDLVFDVNPEECGGYSAEVGVSFHNGTAIDMKNVKMYYDINGETRVDEMIPNVDSLGSEDYTFIRVPVFNTPGTNTLTAGLGCDDDESNNTLSTTFNIVPSPSGAQLTQGIVWNGYFEAGNQANPDVTVADYVVEYMLTSPSKYSDADYGSDWTITPNIITSGGDPVGAADGFVITNPSGSTPGKITIDPDPSLAGSDIYVSLLINDLNTGCDSVIGRWMYIPYTPTPDFVVSEVCLGDNMILKNTSMMGGTDPIISTWDYNDPGSNADPAESSDGFWEYSTYGEFDVILKTVNYYYPIFEYTITKTVEVRPVPEIDYKVINACEGVDVQFNNSTTLPVPGSIGYKWDFGDGTTSTLESPTHSYAAATPEGYVVTLTATSTADGCPSTVTKKAYQFARPVADFSSEGSCNLEDIQFTNETSLAIGRSGYSWDFGDGSVSTLKDPVHVYSTPGTKSVTLKTYSEFGCDDEQTIEITLLESPEADFTYTETCNLTPVEFTRTGSVPSGTNSAFSWNFNDDDSSTDENPSYLFSEVGSKSVTLEITSLNGCASSITKEFDIALQPAADFEVADVCEDVEAVFTNKSRVAAGDLTYEWKFGDNETSADVSPTHQYDITGTTRVVNVTLTAYVAGGCEAEISKPLTLIAAPDASFDVVREGRTVKLDGPSDMNAYRWRFGDGERSSLEDPVYTYNNTDVATFEICLSVRNNDQCWNEECELIEINLLGIEGLDKDKLRLQVYPNPGTGIFNLSVNKAGSGDNISISVSDVLGNVIPVSITDKLNGNYVLDLSEVATGMYFVQVQDGQYKATKRITVSR